jgi:hypothetical protein
VIYDFGSVVKLERRQHIDLLALFSMTANKQNPLAALLAVGFDVDMLLPLQGRLSAMMMVLLEPFISENKFVFDKWNRKERIGDILGEDRWNFMVAAPSELFLFMRSIYGLFHYSEKLTGSIYCKPALDRVLLYYKDELVKSANVFQADFPVEEGLSEYMIISVKESGAQKVKLTMPARAIDNLTTIIPPDIGKKLFEQKIDTKALVKKVRQNCYRPQEVFDLKDGDKQISVYLI